jgi:hypothetical protein
MATVGSVAFAAVIALGVPLVRLSAYLAHRRSKPKPYGRCPACGYNVAPTLFYCPECHKWIDSAKPRPVPVVNPTSGVPTFPGGF